VCAVIVIDVIIRRLVVVFEIPAVNVIDQTVVIIINAVVWDLKRVCPDCTGQVWVVDLDTSVNLQQQQQQQLLSTARGCFLT
jgi:hypothetical protein